MKTLGYAIALMPFVLGSVMFAIGSPLIGAFAVGCGGLSVAFTADMDTVRRLWRNTAFVREMAAAAFMLTIILILSIACIAHAANGHYWQAAFNFAAAVFLAVRS